MLCCPNSNDHMTQKLTIITGSPSDTMHKNIYIRALWTNCKITEYPTVSVDQFDDASLKSDTFFFFFENIFIKHKCNFVECFIPMGGHLKTFWILCSQSLKMTRLAEKAYRQSMMMILGKQENVRWCQNCKDRQRN